MIFHVGGADDGEFIHPRDHENNAVIFVLQNVGLRLIVCTGHHNMAAFDQTDAVWRFQLQAVVEEMFYPRTGSVHQTFGAPGEGFAGVDIFGFHHPHAVLTPCAGHAGAGTNFAATFFHFLCIEDH
ncbi:hypothetical protein SRABI106_00695 [Rahnella aquatilis]|nr:hypothetical protein SRABI106_00695 [Rahnella aquatilis]